MNPTKGPFWRTAYALVSFGFILAFGIVFMRTSGAGPEHAFFIDTDDFTRAVKILQLMQGRSWFDGDLGGVWPGVLELHWTRPSDIAVLLGALPLSLLGLAPKAAIAWAAAFAPPFLLALFVAAWTWAVAPLASSAIEKSLQPLAPIFVLGLVAWFAPMRIDHHGFIALMETVLFGFAVRIAIGIDDHRRAVRTGIVAGLAAGFALWVSVEELLFVGCLFASSAGAWALRGKRTDMLANLAMALAAAASTGLCVLLERGLSEAVHPAYTIDRLSAFHFLLVAAVAAGWATLSRPKLQDLGTGGLPARCIAGAAAAAIAAAVIGLIQPQVFKGFVSTNVDPAYIKLRAHFINEGLPVVSPATIAADGILGTLRRVGFGLFPAILGGGVVLFGLLRSKDATLRAGYACVALWALTFVAWQGWPTNANGVWLNLFGASLMMRPVAAVAARSPIRPEAIAGYLAFALFLGLAYVGAPPSAPLPTGILAEARADEPGDCDIPAAISALKGGSGKQTVMTYPDLGPVMLWSLDAEVLSIPNHHRQPGFEASFDAFTAAEDGKAKAIVDAHGVTAVVMCDAYAMRPFFGLLPSQGDDLGKRLVNHQPPSWLKEVPLQGASGKWTRVYKVMEGGAR